jgi:hypothetical protein
MATQVRPGTTKKRTRWPLILAVAAAAILVVAGIAYVAWPSASGPPGTQMADQGNRHVPTAETAHEPYNSDPPTSGPHLPYIAPWGVHARPISRELQVHNLEDGGVVVQYSCDCPEVVAKLRAIVERYDKQVILAPYPTMKARIALTAWTRLETLDEPDEKRIVRFIEAYRGIDHHPR